MKFMVGYNDSPAARKALNLAGKAAQKEKDVLVYLVTSVEADSEKAISDIADCEEKLQEAKNCLIQEKISCETVLLTSGLSPGENLLKFAADLGVDHIFLGIEKVSRTKKVLLGSTAQFIILKAECPVTTIR